MQKQKLIIDADTGVDDSIAILYALRRPDVQVLGITTGFGNTTAEQAAENTLRLIGLAQPGYPVPVALGAPQNLAGEAHQPPAHIHGANGIANVELPPVNQRPTGEDAASFIVRMAHEAPGEITLVTLGRLTNLALALKIEPALPRLLKRVVAMGGTLWAPGNLSPVAEANIGGDALAADIVFCAGFNLLMVGLDVTMKTRLKKSQVHDLAQLCTTQPEAGIANYLQQALPYYMAYYRRQNNLLSQMPLHDPLAMLIAINPALATNKTYKARVEQGGQYCSGMVVADGRPNPFDAQYVEFCVDVDSEAAVNELLAAFAPKS